MNRQEASRKAASNAAFVTNKIKWYKSIGFSPNHATLMGSIELAIKKLPFDEAEASQLRCTLAWFLNLTETQRTYIYNNMQDEEGNWTGGEIIARV